MTPPYLFRLADRAQIRARFLQANPVIMFVLLAALFFLSAVVSIAATIPNLIASASTLHSVSLPRDSEVRSTKIVGQYLGLVYETADSSIAVVHDESGTQYFRHAEAVHESSKIWSLDVSDNGLAIIVGQSAAPEGGYYSVYSAAGRKLFDKLSTASLKPSPNGDRFCLQYTGLYNGPLSVFDTSGKDIIRPIRLRRAWNAKFFGNDALFVTESDSCRLINLSTGETTWAIATGLNQPGLTPLVRFSPSDSAFLVFDTKSVSCIGMEGVCRWTSDFGLEFISDVAADLDKGRALIRVCRADYLSGYLVEASTSEPRVLSTSRDFVELRGTAQRGFPTMWFQHGIAFVWTPQDQSFSRLSSDVSYKTILIEMSDSETNVDFVADGLMIPMSSRETEMRYLRINQRSKVSVMKAEVTPR